MHLAIVMCLAASLGGEPKGCLTETLVLNGPSDTPQTCLIKGQEAIADLMHLYPEHRVVKWGCKRG